ncbi:hypothetical protein SUDANB15_00012 [Streptomyces sp. enrichment culture]
MLRERLFHRLSELVCGGASGFQLDEEGEHLRAERVLDQRRLVGPRSAEDVTETVGFRLDTPLAAGSLESSLELRPAQPCSS